MKKGGFEMKFKDLMNEESKNDLDELKDLKKRLSDLKNGEFYQNMIFWPFKYIDETNFTKQKLNLLNSLKELEKQIEKEIHMTSKK